MSTETHLSESARGYLSEESKRRFTIVAGLLGAVFFVAQVVLPVLIVFLIMFPMMFGREFASADLGHSTLWRNEAWFVERAHKVNWRAPANSPSTLSLKHLRLTDLSQAGDAVPLDLSAEESNPVLLPSGDRLWVIGPSTVSYYEGGSLTRLGGSRRPAHASQPFVHEGHPAVITLGRSPMLAVLHVEGGKAEWRSTPFPLEPAVEETSIREVHVVQAGERQYLIAEACTDEPDVCSLSYREMGQSEWLPLVADVCSCASWTPVAMGQRPAVVLVQRTNEGREQLAIITGTTTGGQRQEYGDLEGRLGWGNRRALASGASLLLLSEGMPGSRKLIELLDGKVVRSVTKEGSFPFGPNMMVFMLVPQSLPVVLSLALAFILTTQMRKHRVQNYVAHGVTRTFASLWQRAWAQLVDALVLGLGFLIPSLWMWRMFSHPESMMENGGRWFPFVFFGLIALGFLWVLLMLVAFSYLEGRYGKTPGKWLLKIRVVGTDLAPCGFGRALVRNLLTFVDGFFNFLVGLLLVALTENWQRLGDLAARTLVVVDEKGAR